MMNVPFNPVPSAEGDPGQASRLWFFQDHEALQRFRTAVAACRKTPFREGGRVPGPAGGLDCVGYCESVMAAAGLVSDLYFPREPKDFSRHVHNDKILDYLRGNFPDPQSARLAQTFAELPLPEKKKITAFRYRFEPAFLPGDLVIMMTGKGQWHMPMMLTSQGAFTQCAFPDGVSEGDLLAPNYHAHLVALFRARATPNLQSAIGNRQ